MPGDLKIKANDILYITFSSLSINEDLIYNAPAGTALSVEGNASTGFHVSSDGYIFVHQIGKVKAEGLTRKELKANLEKLLTPFLKDVLVTVNFSNHFVTVLGDIGNPQLFKIPNERLTILDLLAQSGATSPVANLKKVLVIRETDKKKEFRHVNLEDHSIFTSPYFYLQPNDVVVVGQNEQLVIQQAKQERYRQNASIIFQTLSIAIIIYQAFFRR